MADEGWRLSPRCVVALAMAALAFHTTTTACAPDVGIEGDGPTPVRHRKRTTDTTLPSDAGGTPEAGPPRPTCIAEKEAFAPQVVNPPAPVQTGACTAEQIDALAAACATDPGAPECTAAREQAPDCTACIFSQSSDPTWKAIVIGPESAFYNQAGCIEHATKVPGCGAEFTNLVACHLHHCSECGAARWAECTDAVNRAECQPHLHSASCANAIEENRAAVDVCFLADTTPDALKELFGRLAAVQCPP
jgi:hypothetical protein